MNALLMATSILSIQAAMSSRPPTGEQFMLRFQPPKEAKYDIRRVWKAIPPTSGNGCQTHQLSITVTAVGSPKWRLGLAITRFKGQDHGPDGHRLAQLSRNVTKLKLTRTFRASGPQTPWRFDGFNESEWAGMMAAKACGLYEVGVFELHFPPKPVSVGSSWNAPVHLGDEGLDSDQMSWVKGNNPRCTYHLDSIDSRAKTAAISFRVETTVTGSFKDIFSGKATPYLHTEKLAGRWIIDLATGMPVKFTSKRSVVIAAQPSTKSQSQTEITETEVTRSR